MSRDASGSDFYVDVEGIGKFSFARRAMRDVYRIRGLYGSLTDGFYDEVGNFADLSALGYATIKVLVVSQPDGFDIDKLDPLLDDDCDAKVMKVFSALREKELSFRPQPAADGEGTGTAARA